MRWLFSSDDDAGMAVEPMIPADLPDVSRIHAQAFERFWSDGEYAALLAQETVDGFVLRRGGRKRGLGGFVLFRRVVDEAEILMVCTERSMRRKGVGRALMNAAVNKLHAERISALFLEVEEGNAGAIALYRRFGFRDVARREAYYESKTGRSAALVMRLDMAGSTTSPGAR